ELVKTNRFNATQYIGGLDGLVMALTSVALLDLAEIYESDVKTVSHFITIRCVAELLGSLIGGKLYDTYNTQVISILTMLMAFGTVLMIPISGTLALALAMVFIGGLSFGAFDTGANVWTIRLWPENSSPALQVYHLSFGIGSLGLVMALTSVALLDLAEIYESDVKTVSHFITIRCVAELLGSLIGGKLYDTYNTQVVTILTMLMAFGTVLLIPISGTLALALAMVFVGGLSFGAFDTGANVWTMRLWPENSNPALQVYHLSFGIGSLAAPLLAEPFLSTLASSSSEPLDATFNDTVDFLNDTVHVWTQRKNATSKESRIQYAFGIASGFYLIPLVSMIALYLVDNGDFKLQDTTPTEVSSGEKEAADNARFTRVLLTLLCAHISVYVALECTTGQMLTAYAVKCDLHLTKSSASHLTAVYFSSFAASRIMAAIMLVVSHIILAVAATLLLIWGSSLEIVLW
ncbi:sodium-dependent glucose transporter, putative, partial [Ixodes scapularis]